MKSLTFAEKILNAKAGSIVFARPDIILTHDNTASIFKTFQNMGGTKIADPDQILVVLDHNAPPPESKLANQYQEIRNIVASHGIRRFYDAGRGICHQIMSYHARPGMLIVGSDSHTSTAGAFNAFATGIDRTEAAGIWKKGETWFRVPESLKIILTGSMNTGVYAKDLGLWIIGMTGSDGANYMSVEFHGEGVNTLSVSDRMTLANLASEMGAKNAVFPADSVLIDFLNSDDNNTGIWADEGAHYVGHIDLDLNEIVPVVSAPHSVDNVKSVKEVAGIPVSEGLIGTCTNGRLEDLRVAAEILRGRKIMQGFQLNVIPASDKILLQAINEGIVSVLVESGACILPPSCGPCLGTGLGIPASGHNVISTANRNFIGRMGNKEASIYLASPATVALSAIHGVITDPRSHPDHNHFTFKQGHKRISTIIEGNDNRKSGNIWNYSDIDNLNTDQMFPGKYTYSTLSSEPESIILHLFEDFDLNFRTNAKPGDIIVGGENFGCGSSREHPAVGLFHIGIKAVIVKSVNRIFYRSSINQGLVLIVHREAVEAYRQGDEIEISLEAGEIKTGGNVFCFNPLPEGLRAIIEMKGLVSFIKHSENKA
jgi:homoaconitate hydratase family protein/3-isopropylmalate dehydratase small subunit